MDASADLLKVNHRLESRVPEIGLLGSEGGATSSVVPTPIDPRPTDPGGAPLYSFLGQPMELTRFLRLAIGLAAGLSKLHGRGFIHKDIKPANILADPITNKAWFTGFGISSRLIRERQAVELPEMISPRWASPSTRCSPDVYRLLHPIQLSGCIARLPSSPRIPANGGLRFRSQFQPLF